MSAVAVVNGVFATGLPQALRNSANDLAFEKQWIDYLADIVFNGVSLDFDHAGIRVDLELANMTAIGKGAGIGREILAGV